MGGGPSIAMDIACLQVIAENSVWDSYARRFARTSATAKIIVFNVQKLLYNSVDLTPRQRCGKKLREWNEGRSCGFWPPKAVSSYRRVKAHVYQELLRQYVVRWV
jgi:hypothetical protein